MSVIADVYSCCRQLTASVVKTRKEALASLLRHLELEKTRSHLDEVSANVLSGRLPEPTLDLEDPSSVSESMRSRLYRHLSWNKVVHAVIRMVELEAQRATKRKTAAVRPDISVALREVIRIADQEAPRLFLSIRAVYQHIIDILRDLNVAKSFCAAYCQLLYQILEVDGYCSLIRRQNFSDFLKILTYFVGNASQFTSVDQIQNARALLVVLRAYPFDMTEHLPKVFRSLLQILTLYEFLSVIQIVGTSQLLLSSPLPSLLLTSCRNEVLEDSRQTLFVLTALNHVTLTNSCNAGVQFLAVGEQLSSQILSLLGRTRDPNIREQTLIFFKLQARLHIDYCGAVSGLHGIFTETTAGKGILEVLANVLEQQRLPKGKIDDRCMELGSVGHMFDLIGDIAMIMGELGLALNATGTLQEQPPHKRKRKSDIGTELCKNGWEFLALHLTHSIERSSESLLVWLQATTTVLQKHGRKLPSTVAEKIFVNLSGAILSSERHDISSWTLRCLRQLAWCHLARDPVWNLSWEAVWHTVLKRLSFPLPSFVATEGISLMEALLCCDLVEKQVIHSKQDLIWALPLYQEDGPSPAAALSFLAEFLRRFELQDGARAKGSPSLRCFLLHRVVTAFASPMSTTKQPISDGSSLDPALVAALLIGLVHPGPVLEGAADCFISSPLSPGIEFGDGDLPSVSKLDHISEEEINFYLDQLDTHHHLFRPDNTMLFGPMSAPPGKPAPIFKVGVPEKLQPTNSMSVRERMDAQKRLVCLLESVATSITEETNAVLSRKKKTLGIDSHRLCLNQCRLHCLIRVLILFFGYARSAPAVCDELATYLPAAIQELSQHAVHGLSYFLSDTRKLQLFVFPTLKDVISAASLHLPAKLSKPLLGCVTIVSGFLESQDRLLTRDATVRVTPTDSAGVVDLTSEFDLCMDEDDTAELSSVAAVYSHDCALVALECLTSLASLPNIVSEPIADTLSTILEHPSSPAIKFAVIHCLLSVSSTRHVRDILAQVENVLLAAEFSSSAQNRSELLRIITMVAGGALRAIQAGRCGQPSECLKTLDNIVSVFSELWRGNKLNWHTRREFCRCASALLRSDVDRFDGLSSILLDMVEDADCRVRIFASGIVPTLFSIYNEEEMIFNDLYSHISNLMRRESTQEERVTALFCLANIGAVSQVVEPRVMFELYSEASNPDVTELVSRLLDCMASCLGYGTSGGLIEAHLQFIVDKWISGEDKRGLDDFPVQLCNCSTVNEFVCKYTNIVLPHAVYSMDSSVFQYVAEVVGLNGTALVSKYMPAVFVYTFPLYYSDHRRAQSIFEKFLPKHAPQLALGKQIQANLDEILVLLIDAASVASQPVPPDHSVQSIEQVLSHIAGKYSVLDLFQRKSGRVQGILLHLRVKFHSHVHATPKVRALQSTEFLINILKQAVATPNIIRTVVHYLLEAVASKQPRVHSLACELLLQVCKSCVEFGGAQDLGQYLNQIVCTLVPFVATQPLAMSILSYLIIEAGNRLGTFIGELDPLPDIPQLSTIIERWEYFNEHVGGDIDLLRELKRFRRVASSSASSTLHEAGLARLTAFCKESKSRLLEFVDVNKEGRDLLSSLVWELIRLCSPQRTSEQVRLQAAKCLGELGVMNPYAIAFSSADMSFSLASEEVLAAVTAQRKSQLTSRDTRLLWRAICTALYALNTHQVDPAIEVVVAATSALRRVLRTKEGMQVLSKLQHTDERSYNYLRPWASSSSAGAKGHQISSQLSQDPLDVILLEDEIWNPSDVQYSAWLCTLTERLASTLPTEYETLRICAPMCRLKLSFAEAVFPYVLAGVLLSNGGDEASRVGVLLERYVLSTTNVNVEATQYFLTVLNFLREEASARGQPEPIPSNLKGLRSKRKQEKVTPFWESLLWPRVNLLSIAEAAQRCAAFLTSVLFVEVWHDQQKGALVLTRSTADEDKRARQLLLVAYSSINEPDAILGLSHQFDMLSQIKVAEHEGQWETVAHSYDSLLSLGQHHVYTASTDGSAGSERLRNEQGLVSALQRSGFGHMTSLFLKGFSARFPNQFLHLSDAQFEHYWRSCIWTLDTEQWQLLDNEQTGFHKALHSGLRALSEVDENAMRNSLLVARLGLARDLQSTSLESTKYVHPVLVKLHMLEELENAWCLFKSDSATDSLESSQLSALELGSAEEKARWEGELVFLSSNSFDEIEPLLALRTTVLTIAGCSEELQNHLRNVAKLARSSGRLQIAARASFRLEQLGRGEAGAVQAHWEQCKLLWSKGEHSRAVSAAEALLDVASTIDSWSDRFLADLRYAISKWMASSGSAGLQDKISGLVKEALLDYMQAGDKEKICACHYTLARYLDGLYQGLSNKMSSPEWQASLRLRKQKEAEYNLCRQKVKDMEKGSAERDHLEITLGQIRRSLDVERLESRKLREGIEIASHLHKSVRHYLYCLVNGGKHDNTAVFRVCSLWFSNAEDKRVNELVNSHIMSIPSFKWVTLIYQIASRMTAGGERFQLVLKALIERIAIDHPHHSLYQLFAMSNADRVQSKVMDQYRIDDGKRTAASSLLAELRRSEIGKIVKAMEPLVEQYIKVAILPLSREATNGVDELALPNGLRKLKDLVDIPVATAMVTLQPSANYENLVTVHSFSPVMKLVGGVHLPRVAVCIGSDGKNYRQLIKGNDDLRQDAVMQQMFHMVNTLLKADTETRKRCLKIRTYKVLPLSPVTGILEWVENTTPLSDYLVGRGRQIYDGAHLRYRPGDMLSIACRNRMAKAKDKQEAFAEVTDNFKPVFHHFFLEHYKQPAEWFEKRIDYTRSMASNSIVGYIVGLGDRHPSNILIDTTSAELVHIDLGVAFEQGKMLRIPETVPFRLTRDLVDGMGATGTEGVYRRCCEETMRVLRQQHEALLTIVEVFVHDPLYRWALSPLRALALQRADDDGAQSSALPASSDEVGAGDAEKTLSRVRQKLQGVEYGGVTSVEEQIALLIDEAQDPARLAHIFYGWKAWV